MILETLDCNIRFVLAIRYEQRALPETCKDLPRCDTPVDLRHLACALFEGSRLSGRTLGSKDRYWHVSKQG